MKSKGTVYLRTVCADLCVFATVSKTFDGQRFDGEPKCGVGLSPEEIEIKFDGMGCDKSAIAVSGIVGVDPASQKWITRGLDILVAPAIISIAEDGYIQIPRQEKSISMSKHLTNIGFRK